MVSNDVLSQLPFWAARYRAATVTAAEYAALYVLHWQVARFGARVAQRRSRSDAPVDGMAWLRRAQRLDGAARAAFLVDLYRRYDLRGVRRRVGIALHHWLCAAWPVQLLEQVPTPRAVLRMQARGQRPVTVIAAYPRLLRPVLDKPDAFTFVCHDLEHAWQFFHDPQRYQAQQRFARRLERAWTMGVFDRYLPDPVFAEKFVYLAADMNTHVLHSLQYLRAILIEYHLRRDGLDAGARLSASSRTALRASLAALFGEAGQCVDAFDALSDGRLSARDAALLEAAVCA